MTYAAASGLTPGEVETQIGMAVSTGEVSGALTGASLTEADILAGHFDDAEVTSFLVNWAQPEQRIVTDSASIGEIRRTDGAFLAELRGPMHRYDQEQGRHYTTTCSADLGDVRCGVNVAAHTANAVIAAVQGRLTLDVDGLSAVPPGRFSNGRISFAAGPNAGLVRMIRQHAGDGQLLLWEPFPHLPEEGDAATLIAGCDKRFATCQAVFANAANFRGFPDIPTPDFILTYARPGEGGHDGGRRDP